MLPPMTQEQYVEVSALARMLGPGWTRSSVWYWLHAARIEFTYLPGPWGRGMGVIPAHQLNEVLHRLRTARAARRHDGQGGGEARARRLRQGGVY